MFQVYICDEEISETDQLVNLLMSLSESLGIILKPAYISHSPEVFLRHFDGKPSLNNLYFLDIELKHNLNGLELSKEIRNRDPLGHIIFVTNYSKYLPYTYEYFVSPLAYLIKGQKDTLYQQLRKIILTLDKRINRKFNNMIKEEIFIIKYNQKVYHIPLNQIILLESMGNHRISLVADNEAFLFYSSMKQIEKEYPKLLRIHESFIINPQRILSINFQKREVYLDKHWVCPIGTTYLPKLRE